MRPVHRLGLAVLQLLSAVRWCFEHACMSKLAAVAPLMQQGPASRSGAGDCMLYVIDTHLRMLYYSPTSVPEHTSQTRTTCSDVE
jgi:hypothetical protein